MNQTTTSRDVGSANKFPVKARDLVHVVWGEEREAIPALVIDVSAEGFTAFVRPPLAEDNLGPFSFFFSDLSSSEGSSNG